jgi:hypothetical protein
MEEPRSSVPDELPVACTLGTDDGSERMRRWEDLADTGRPTARRNGPELEVLYQSGSGVQAELEKLAAAEQECCAFVVWTVTQQDGQPILRVVAKPEAPDDIASIAALFGVIFRSS